MGKLRAVAWVIIAVSAVYVMLGVFIRYIADTIVSVNAEMAAAHNMSQYAGTSDFLLATPWILYIAPAVIGIVLIIVILKRSSSV